VEQITWLVLIMTALLAGLAAAGVAWCVLSLLFWAAGLIG
jgi:hypothetical protein